MYIFSHIFPKRFWGEVSFADDKRLLWKNGCPIFPSACFNQQRSSPALNFIHRPALRATDFSIRHPYARPLLARHHVIISVVARHVISEAALAHPDIYPKRAEKRAEEGWLLRKRVEIVTTDGREWWRWIQRPFL